MERYETKRSERIKREPQNRQQLGGEILQRERKLSFPWACIPSHSWTWKASAELDHPNVVGNICQPTASNWGGEQHTLRTQLMLLVAKLSKNFLSNQPHCQSTKDHRSHRCSYTHLSRQTRQRFGPGGWSPEEERLGAWAADHWQVRSRFRSHPSAICWGHQAISTTQRALIVRQANTQTVLRADYWHV